MAYDIETRTGVTLQLFESSGKRIAILKQEEQSKRHYEMDVSVKGFASGVYILSLLTHETHYAQKFVVY